MPISSTTVVGGCAIGISSFVPEGGNALRFRALS
jgi:hypothetical protein